MVAVVVIEFHDGTKFHYILFFFCFPFFRKLSAGCEYQYSAVWNSLVLQF